MTHRFLIGPDQRHADHVTFTPDQWHQLHDVLRLRVGDSVCVFDGEDPIDHLVLLVEKARGRIEGQRPQAREPRTRVVVYPALLPRDKFETVLQKLTEIGVHAIVPVITARALVREAPDDKRQTRWRSILREATEQSGRGVVPELRAAQSFSEALVSAKGTKVIAYEGESRTDLRAALRERPKTVSLFVGPEGGYEPAEVERARTAGAIPVTLGPRILRTETASPLLAALVLYELGDLSSQDGG